MTREQKLEDALRQCRKFMSDAPSLDYKEDRTLSGIAVFGAYIDSLLGESAGPKDDSHA